MIPAIRFKGFSDDWKQRKLGEISRMYQPLTITGNDLLPDGVPVFGANGFIGFFSEANHIDDQVTISARGEGTGTPSYVHGPVWITGNSMVVNVGDFDIDKYFLFANLTANSLKKYVTGGAQPQLTRDVLVKVPITLPNTDEQKQIGAFFKQLDDTIALHQSKLNNFKKLKRGLLQFLFTNSDSSIPMIRFKNFAKKWEKCKLGKLATFSKGSGYSKSDLRESGTPIILYGRLYTNYETIIEDVDTYVIEKEKSVISKGNEVIVPASGETAEDISRASVVARAGIILAGDLNIIKPGNKIDSAFLALTISNGSQKKELSKRAQGKSIVHLHNSDLKEVLLVFPSVEEQQRISLMFEQLDKVINIHKSKIQYLKNIKVSLLQRMFI